ncbi:NADPH:quinone oxidoreductase family protein [Nereida sp. MMG025]|uniref:NADPH:quinone oxidoreductase family protein n=1 Tax=Nereida sp. MMG025 TaxID=2909981 RepID=UPI001F362D3F|nr:NADPH:quinone oxidoreductase family protein [Nereida sp. MMG025]MCF6443945.1 NADPH:quinone oxidoreductase family protein [Nereida sp. MMG025]
MRAFQVTELNAPPKLLDLAAPACGAGEVRIKVATCGLNFGDLLMITGAYQERPALPFTLGMEIAGTVDAIGEDVSGVSIGQRVVGFGGHGGLADYCTLPANRCVALPDTMDDITAAAFQVAYGTSHLALTHRARLMEGETLLVLGAAGGVGLTAVEIGVQLGATVIACARGADKLAVCKAAGAHHTIDSDTQDLTAEVKALGGADVVYDPVGGALFTAALKATNRGGRVLVIGFASGDVPPVPANILLVKNIDLIGFYWGGYLALDPKPLTDSLATLMDWHGQGRLKPHVSHTLPLEQAAEGLDLLKSRKSTGKVVITI